MGRNALPRVPTGPAPGAYSRLVVQQPPPGEVLFTYKDLDWTTRNAGRLGNVPVACISTEHVGAFVVGMGADGGSNGFCIRRQDAKSDGGVATLYECQRTLVARKRAARKDVPGKRGTAQLHGKQEVLKVGCGARFYIHTYTDRELSASLHTAHTARAPRHRPGSTWRSFGSRTRGTAPWSPRRKRHVAPSP